MENLMGQAIVYCSRCNTRLLETDFEKGKASFVERIPFCSPCLREAPPLQVVEADASSESGPSDPRMRHARRVDGGEKPAPGPWLLVAAAAVVLVGVVTAGVTGGRAPSPPPPEVPITLPEPPPPPPTPAPRPEPAPHVVPDPVNAELAKLEEELRSPLRKEEVSRIASKPRAIAR